MRLLPVRVYRPRGGMLVCHPRFDCPGQRPRLRERLAAEWASASKEKKFGLVFEDHMPELLPLYKAKPRRGDLVRRREGPLKDVWRIQQIKDGVAVCIKPGDGHPPSTPRPAESRAVVGELLRCAADELLVVRQFGEPIFPPLVPVDAVANGPTDAPWHTLIESDNVGDYQEAAVDYQQSAIG